MLMRHSAQTPSSKLYPPLIHTHSSSFPSFCIAPCLPSSGFCGLFDAVSQPFFRTSRQGHSQSKCMLILILQEPPASLLFSSCPDVALWAPEGGGDLEQSHLTTRLDTTRPWEPDLMEAWMFNGAFLASNTILQPRDGKITKTAFHCI